MPAPLDRRRVIAILAAVGGLGLIPFGRESMAEAHVVTWRGQALGAPASLTLHHHDRAEAGRLIERAVTEVRRLERVFSLYRDDSALVELNRTGALVAPPADMVRLLEASRAFRDLSEGAFDPTVQPLWILYGEHFAAPAADPSGPSEERLREVATLVGLDGVRFSRDRIAFARHGMALTFNGIAQGYITDKVVELLRSGGITKSLVDMGEIRALGTRPDDSPWRVGVAAMQDAREPEAILEIVDKAVATSSGGGFRFDGAGRFNHLLDPRDGRPARLYRSVTVVAPKATDADALSTAFSLMERSAIANVLKTRPDMEVYLTARSGDRLRLHGNA
ncbi:FAD:protein FMN transferase [Aurantimonas marina]|uniref:FAD:protein FMN transferase n=1 Tax=Aurantimonas marina TaxID=2780508 RepID=UPI0019D2C055|nr:FAD:protein FMN transferase [Aurantimonas marina]